MIRKILGVVFALMVSGCGNEIDVEAEKESKAVWDDLSWNKSEWQ